MIASHDPKVGYNVQVVASTCRPSGFPLLLSVLSLFLGFARMGYVREMSNSDATIIQICPFSERN